MYTYTITNPQRAADASLSVDVVITNGTRTNTVTLSNMLEYSPTAYATLIDQLIQVYISQYVAQDQATATYIASLATPTA